MEKTKKKTKTSWVGIVVLLFLGIQIVFVTCIFLQEIYPKSWTKFRSYSQFVKVADWTFYDQVLPESAHDMRYYYYEGGFDDTSGYHAAFSAEDYESEKKRLWESYKERSPEYLYNGSEKIYLDREEIKEARVDFLDILLPEDKDNGEFYFLIYGLPRESREIYNYEAVLCNDSTYEIIELSCRFFE